MKKGRAASGPPAAGPEAAPDDGPGAGLVVANLLAEAEWAGEQPALPAKARQRLGAAGLLMAAFLRGPRDRLWLPEGDLPPKAPAGPAPADERRGAMAGDWGADTAAAAQLLLGPSPPAAGPFAVLAWASTPRIRGLAEEGLADAPFALPPGARGAAGGATSDWRAPFWRTPLADPELARRLASRAWYQRSAAALGLALPGSSLLGSADLLPALVARGEPSGAGPAWVLKRLWSAAGRDRLWLGPSGPDPAQWDWIRGCLARDGALLLEPWMPRLADWGCVGLVEADRVDIVGSHRQVVDARGRFQGIRLWPGAARPTELPDPELPGSAASLLQDAALQAGAALAAEGYRGPFGIDAWSYRDRSGRWAFQALGEVNVRLTMGLLAWAWCRYLSLPPDGRAWELRPHPPGDPRLRAAAIPLPPAVLLRPNGVGAWLRPVGAA